MIISSLSKQVREIFSKRNIDEAVKKQKSPTRILLEFEVAQSQWEYKHGYVKVYDSVEKLIKDIQNI